jgi:hypothetical protein
MTAEKAPSGYVSRFKHPLNAGIHFVLVDEFAARNLVDPDLHLLFEPRVMGKHASHGFLDQIIRSASGSEGEIVQLGFLTFEQQDFHCFQGTDEACACQRHSGGTLPFTAPGRARCSIACRRV